MVISEDKNLLVPIGRICERCYQPSSMDFINEYKLHERKCYQCGHSVELARRDAVNESCRSVMTRATLYVLRYSGSSIKNRSKLLEVEYRAVGKKGVVDSVVPKCYLCEESMNSTRSSRNEVHVRCRNGHGAILWRPAKDSQYIGWTEKDSGQMQLMHQRISAHIQRKLEKNGHTGLHKYK